jgi:hypothetical protein
MPWASWKSGSLSTSPRSRDDALRPWIHARDPEDSKRPRKFTFRIIPRDMREIYLAPEAGAGIGPHPR